MDEFVVGGRDGGSQGSVTNSREKKKTLLNSLDEASLSPGGERKHCVFPSALSCRALYAGHYLTLIAEWVFVLGLYVPQLSALHCTRNYMLLLRGIPFIPLCAVMKS